MEDFKDFDEFVRDELTPELTIVRPLGRGSVASVYLAREAALDRQVAVKVISPKYAQDKTTLRRFEREARAIARITHPNVTAVYRVGRLSNGLPYFIMEYVDGRNLEDSLAATDQMPIAEGRDILRQLAAGLAAAHAQNIVHRDVKPANVLRESATGRVVLTDFGLAAARDRADETTRLTMVGQVLGSLPFVSPEHLSGEELTDLADIYALGVLGYHVFTGRGPYDAESAAEVTIAHLRTPPIPLSTLRPDVDAALSGLLGRCLAKRPEQRPSAADVARQLETGVSVATAPPATGWGQFLAELKRRHVYKVGAAYLGFLLVLIGLLSGLRELSLVPDQVARALVGLAVGGLPVSLALSWTFDVRAGRIERTVDASTGGVLRGRVIPALALLGSLVVAVLVWWGVGLLG